MEVKVLPGVDNVARVKIVYYGKEIANLDLRVGLSDKIDATVKIGGVPHEWHNVPTANLSFQS